MNTIPAIRNKIYTPDSFEKGHAFEDYIISLIDNRSKRFRLLNWRSDKRPTNGMFVESNSLPDLEFAYTGKYKQKFAIECKWRYKFYNDKIGWASEYQIINYLQYQKEYNIPVFIAIGVGGEPANPENLYITPLSQIQQYPEVYKSQLLPFYRNTKTILKFDAEQLKLF